MTLTVNSDVVQEPNHGRIYRDSTVDFDDAAKYASMADQWWDTSGVFWPLHALNNLRVDYLKKVLSSNNSSSDLPLHNLKCLDIGCGGGLLSEKLSRLGGEVTGIDVVEKNVEIAKLHARRESLNIDYKLQSAANLLASGERYDWVFNMEVVEHVEDFPRFMSDCARLVKPGGNMIVATINRTYLSYLLAILGAEYILGWLPKGTHQWRKFRKPNEISACLINNGLDIFDKKGIKINPFTKKFSLSAHTSVNYMLVAHKSA